MHSPWVSDTTASIAVGQALAAEAAGEGRHALLAQVATYARNGTLGILTVSGPANADGPAVSDSRAGKKVLADPALELYQPLWQEPVEGDELTSTRGRSVPTFHGSAADLAAVATCLLNLLAHILRLRRLRLTAHLGLFPRVRAAIASRAVTPPTASRPAPRTRRPAIGVSGHRRADVCGTHAPRGGDGHSVSSDPGQPGRVTSRLTTQAGLRALGRWSAISAGLLEDQCGLAGPRLPSCRTGVLIV
jgi:hypothetical protein